MRIVRKRAHVALAQPTLSRLPGPDHDLIVGKLGGDDG